MLHRGRLLAEMRRCPMSALGATGSHADVSHQPVYGIAHRLPTGCRRREAPVVPRDLVQRLNPAPPPFPGETGDASAHSPARFPLAWASSSGNRGSVKYFVNAQAIPASTIAAFASVPAQVTRPTVRP